MLRPSSRTSRLHSGNARFTRRAPLQESASGSSGSSAISAYTDAPCGPCARSSYTTAVVAPVWRAGPRSIHEFKTKTQTGPLIRAGAPAAVKAQSPAVKWWLQPSKSLQNSRSLPWYRASRKNECAALKGPEYRGCNGGPNQVELL